MKRSLWLSAGTAGLGAAVVWSLAPPSTVHRSSGDDPRHERGSTPAATTARVASAGDPDAEVNLPEQCVGVAVVTPAYLPTAVLPVPDVSCGSHNVLMVFRLVGAANSDTFPPSGAPTQFDGSQHPASVLSYAVTDNPTGLLPDGIDQEFFAVRDVTLTNGALVRVATPLSGYGPYRLDWSLGNKLFTLLGARGSTDQGDSGLPVAELIKIADSVPSPQV